MDSWRLPGWEVAEVFLRDSIKKSGVHPIDPIAIACKTEPIPLKDLDEKWLRKRSDGWYGGYPILETLLKEQFETIIDGVTRTVCRWAVNYVDENLRNAKNLILQK